MRVLALDTTTRAGSVAVVEDERVVAERRGDESRTHAERLPAEPLGFAVDANYVPAFSVSVEMHRHIGIGLDVFDLLAGHRVDEE